MVGGGNSAVEEALFLTKFASKVVIVHRRDKFRASKIMIDRTMNNPKISVLWNKTVDEIIGDKHRVLWIFSFMLSQQDTLNVYS